MTAQSDLFESPLQRSAVLSSCAKYRYTLTRLWGGGPTLGVIGLNPSTADAEIDDPTVKKLMRFARDNGFGGFVLGNLFAWRATYPSDLGAVEDPVGPDNDLHLRMIGRTCVNVLCAWGSTPKTWVTRVVLVKELIANIPERPKTLCLRVNADGSPAHPLFLPYTCKLTEYA